MSCADQNLGHRRGLHAHHAGAAASAGSCVDRDFSPFVGTGFSSTSAPLQIYHFDEHDRHEHLLEGKGNAHSLSRSAGLQLATGYVRLSLEYLYEYVFYTGANLNDPQRTPSEALRVIWDDSLSQDRHGIRFQVGFAF